LLTPVIPLETRLESVRAFRALAGEEAVDRFVANLMELLRIARDDQGDPGDIEPVHWQILGEQLNDMVQLHASLQAQHQCVQEAQEEAEQAKALCAFAEKAAATAINQHTVLQSSLDAMTRWQQELLAWLESKKTEEIWLGLTHDALQDLFDETLRRVQQKPVTIEFATDDDPGDVRDLLRDRGYAESIVVVQEPWDRLIRLRLRSATGERESEILIVWRHEPRTLTISDEKPDPATQGELSDVKTTVHEPAGDS
jgi:hypothetical protein